jgi:FecR-like protein
MKTEIGGALWTLTFAVVLAAAGPGWAQEKVGVVTTVVGPVTVARASLPPEPLKFKDDVFVRDRVTTGENAFTRILLGGKVIITAREHSTLTITETPDLSTINLTSGRIAVAVEKSRMKPGERVDIRTPNAVAGVRGTVLIVEAAPSVSTVTVLRGLVHVTRLNSVTGDPVGAFTAIGARQTVTVRLNVLPARSQPIAPSRAEELSREFTPPIQAVTSAVIVPDADEIARARDLAKSDAPAAFSAIEWPTVGALTAVPVPAATAPSAAETGTSAAGPALAAAPVPSTAPSVTTPGSSPAPVVSSAPMPTGAATPLLAPAQSTKTSSKYGSSYKYDKYDRSGSNSGKR